MVTPDGTFALVTDHLGSVRFVVDTDTGEVVQRMEFDAFGQVIENTAQGFQPFGFAGGLYEPETGLVRFGSRDYDPATGRWTAKDPIGFGGGDTNLYGYAFQDPVNLIDPAGTLAIVAGIWVVAEAAMTAYDIYDAQRTVRDPCADNVTKTIAVAAVAAGIILPGSYSRLFRKLDDARRIKPNPNAIGDHTNFQLHGETGNVKRYETFKVNTNPRNPNDWTSVKRFDAEGDSHYNKVTDTDVATPHVHDPNTPGGVRPPESWEIPFGY